MVSPADTHPSPPCDAQPDELDLALAVDRFQNMTTVTVNRLEHSWAGLRTFLPDELPAAGYDPDVDDFFWLVGQGGFGIQTAPGLSELAARLLNERTFKGGPLKETDHALAARISPARLR